MPRKSTKKQVEISITPTSRAGAINFLKSCQDDLERGINPFTILEAHLRQLHKEGKLSLGLISDKIAAAILARTRRENIKPSSCIVLVDVENIRNLMHIPRDSENFPGKIIIEQILEMGFSIREIYGFINSKGPASQIEDQEKVLQDQGFITIRCHAVKDNASLDAVDQNIHRLAKNLGDENTSIIIVSGDKDFKVTARDLRLQKTPLIILSYVSGIADTWRRESNAIPINLLPEEMRYFNCMKSIIDTIANNDPSQLQRLIENPNEEEEVAIGYLQDVYNAISNIRMRLSFKGLVDFVKIRLTPDSGEIFSEEFLHRVISLLDNSTEMLESKKTVQYSFAPKGKHYEFFKQ